MKISNRLSNFVVLLFFRENKADEKVNLNANEWKDISYKEIYGTLIVLADR